MNPGPAQDESVHRLAAAAVWRVRLTEAGLESSSEFEAWLAADPANEIAWRHVLAQWNLLGEHAASPAAIQMRRAALERAGAAGSSPAGAEKKNPRASTLAMLAAAVLVVVCGALWLAIRPVEYRTGFGERRVVTLEDGSRISLDSDTVVKVRYSPQARRLRLLTGQARFDVAHAVTRPFSVEAGDRTVIATGTSFNVDLRRSEVVVTLIEGHVVVTSRDTEVEHILAAAPRTALALDAGQTLTASIESGSPPRVEQASLDTVTSWESGRLIFDNETLAEAVQRVARYAEHPIEIADERAAALRLSGVFNAGDVATFIDTVSRYLPVRAAATADGTIVLTLEPEKP